MTDGSPSPAASLAGAVLDAEALRDGEKRHGDREVLFADDLLPGVGGELMTLRQGVAAGGTFTIALLVALQVVEGLEQAVLTVLAPDIRDTFGVGDGVIVFISAASGAFIVLGSLPMGWLADRLPRSPIIGWASTAFAAMLVMSGLAVNALMLFVARFGAGVAKSNSYPVQGSVLADAYPINVRGRINALFFGASQLAAVLSPAVVGGIAALIGGTEGWRWGYLAVAVPCLPLGVLAFRVPEPPRGQHEMRAVLGEVFEEQRSASVSVEAAVARLQGIKTFRTCMLAFAALGFGLFTGPVLQNLYLERHFGLGSFGRGVVGTVTGIGVLVALPLVARRYDDLYRRDPERALLLLGLLIAPVGVILPIQYVMPNPASFAVVGILSVLLQFTAFAMIGPIVQSVVPYRLRGMGAAVGSMYVFFVGATGGALLAGFFTSAIGPRGAVLAVGVPSTIIGGALIARSSGFIKHDLSRVVAELREELDERRRQEASPDEIPALQVDGVDFSYGKVQVLFDVGFEVRRGEVLALLGTNGAGKSTVLRIVSGLGTPTRGVVRVQGRTVTYVAPERRIGYGVRLLPGGKGVFPGMTVAENLEIGAFAYRRDAADRARRITRVLELFPTLAGRQDQAAGSLSGGQQQMLALAITLLHDIEVLLIDELSLGLSPIVVQQLLGVVEQLKREGMTIVVVEQSLNVALSIADRAVFLEKGRVRFEGPAHELATRGDLVRAVFLGAEGG